MFSEITVTFFLYCNSNSICNQMCDLNYCLFEKHLCKQKDDDAFIVFDVFVRNHENLFTDREKKNNREIQTGGGIF